MIYETTHVSKKDSKLAKKLDQLRAQGFEVYSQAGDHVSLRRRPVEGETGAQETPGTTSDAQPAEEPKDA